MNFKLINVEELLQNNETYDKYIYFILFVDATESDMILKHLFFYDFRVFFNCIEESL